MTEYKTSTLADFFETEDAGFLIDSAASGVDDASDVRDRGEWLANLIKEANGNPNMEENVLDEIATTADYLEGAAIDLRALVDLRKKSRASTNALDNPPHGHDTPDGVDFLQAAE